MDTHPASRSVSHQGEPFLAADVGGTHARLALVRLGVDGGIELFDHRQYACSDFPGLAAIVAEFLSEHGRGPVHDMAIGCAGMHRDDVITSLNLPWPVSLSELRGLGIARVAAVNDFVAVAHAIPHLRPEDCILLCGADAPAASGPVLVIGPGTGLGVAYRIPHEGKTLVLPSEGGHMAFAPGNARELAVLERMLAVESHVPNTQIVSGPGLLALYNELNALDGSAPRSATPPQIVDAARAGNDTHAVEAVRMFCDALGSVAGDLAVGGIATSVYIAGGMVPRMRDLLAASAFHERFTGKGIMCEMLERMPVRLIVHPHQGVIGAAAWYLRGGDAGVDDGPACT